MALVNKGISDCKLQLESGLEIFGKYIEENGEADADVAADIVADEILNSDDDSEFCEEVSCNMVDSDPPSDFSFSESENEYSD